MAALRAQAWDTPCAFFPRYGQLPARAFLLLTVQELVIHTWDIRSCLDASVALAADLLVLDFAIKHRVLKTAQSCSGLPTRGNQPGQ